MGEENDRASRYRARAEEMRAIANECKEPQTAGQLQQVAADYEQMALSLDIVEKTNRLLRRSENSN